MEDRPVHRVAFRAMALALGIAVPISMSGCGRKAPGGTMTAPAASAQSTQLVALVGANLDVVDGSTGAIVRSYDLAADGFALGGSGVTVHRTTAYVASIAGDGCGTIIDAVDLATGQAHEAVVNADSPAVSPDGRSLAYVLVTPSPIASYGCERRTVDIEDLSTGTVRSWTLSGPADHGHSPAIVERLSWSPDGTHLAIGSYLVDGSGISILDLAKPLSAANPRPVVTSSGQYSSPQWLPDGNLDVVRPFCGIDAMSCPAPMPGMVISGLATLNPRSGKVTTTAASTMQLTFAAVDPSGTEEVVLGDGALYRVDGPTLSPLIKGQVFGAAWLPAPTS